MLTTAARRVSRRFNDFFDWVYSYAEYSEMQAFLRRVVENPTVYEAIQKDLTVVLRAHLFHNPLRRALEEARNGLVPIGVFYCNQEVVLSSQGLALARGQTLLRPEFLAMWIADLVVNGELRQLEMVAARLREVEQLYKREGIKALLQQ